MLTRWNSLDRDFDNLVRSLVFNDTALPRARFVEQRLMAPADIVETESAFLVKVDLPGHDPKSLNVQLEKDTLTITSERKAEARSDKDNVLRVERVHGTFSRSFTLPKNVDATQIEASYEQGVLTVSIPKKEEEKPRTIAVKVG